MKVIIGIDPGVNGAVAIKDGDNVTVYQLKKHWLEDVLRPIIGRDAIAYIERVTASPQMGVTSAFTFGGAYHSAKAVLRCYQIPCNEVLPLTWQKIYNLPKPPPKATKEQRAAHKREHKKALYRKAKDLFPVICTSEDRADALLIMEYARREERAANG